MGVPGNGNSVVVKDGKFLGIAAKLEDGNYIVLFPGDPVYSTKEAAISAAIAKETPETKEEWIHE